MNYAKLISDIRIQLNDIEREIVALGRSSLSRPVGKEIKTAPPVEAETPSLREKINRATLSFDQLALFPSPSAGHDWSLGCGTPRRPDQRGGVGFNISRQELLRDLLPAEYSFGKE